MANAETNTNVFIVTSAVILSIQGTIMIIICIICNMNRGSKADLPIDGQLHQIFHLDSAVTMIVIISGLCYISIAFLAFVGFYQENMLLYVMQYLVMVIVIFVFIILGLIISIISTSNVPYYINSTMSDLLQNYNSTKEAADVLDQIQRKYDCCGLKSYRDWNSMDDVPTSCCSEENCSDQEVMRKPGCVDSLGDYSLNHSMRVKILAMCIALLLNGAVIIALIMVTQQENDIRYNKIKQKLSDKNQKIPQITSN